MKLIQDGFGITPASRSVATIERLHAVGLVVVSCKAVDCLCFTIKNIFTVKANILLRYREYYYRLILFLNC